jgi:hypothetical protein
LEIEYALKVGSVVDNIMDEQGNTISVTLVGEAALAKEQAQKTLNFASKNRKQYFGLSLAGVEIPILVAVV